MKLDLGLYQCSSCPENIVYNQPDPKYNIKVDVSSWGVQYRLTMEAVPDNRQTNLR